MVRTPSRGLIPSVRSGIVYFREGKQNPEGPCPKSDLPSVAGLGPEPGSAGCQTCGLPILRLVPLGLGSGITIFCVRWGKSLPLAVLSNMHIYLQAMDASLNLYAP